MWTVLKWLLSFILVPIIFGLIIVVGYWLFKFYYITLLIVFISFWVWAATDLYESLFK